MDDQCISINEKYYNSSDVTCALEQLGFVRQTELDSEHSEYKIPKGFRVFYINEPRAFHICNALGELIITISYKRRVALEDYQQDHVDQFPGDYWIWHHEKPFVIIQSNDFSDVPYSSIPWRLLKTSTELYSTLVRWESSLVRKETEPWYFCGSTGKIKIRT